MIQRLAVLALLTAFFVGSVTEGGIVSPWSREKTKPDVSQGAVVAQVIGVDTWVQIAYHRPGVKGRSVWTEKSSNPVIGFLVPRDGEPRPWRTGANEATTIEFSQDVLIEGEKLAAGKYALFMIPSDEHWTVIFDSKSDQWGSFRYDKANDALRVEVTPVEAPHNEWLSFGFDDAGATSATAWLHWEKLKVPFGIEVPKPD